MARYLITLTAECDNEKDARDFASTIGAAPGDQWDTPPEVNVLEVAEVEEHGD